jgi:hypothetical protein
VEDFVVNRVKPGNLLGDIRAESDLPMLRDAFVPTQDYRALTETRDFNFVVGRRGTGKSALFIRAQEELRAREPRFVHSIVPREYETLELLAAIANAKDYRMARAVCRVAWQVQRARILRDDLISSRSTGVG